MRSIFGKLAMAAVCTAAILGTANLGLAQSAPDEVRVNMNLKDADMLAAIKILTAQTGMQFTLEPSNEPYEKVTLSLHDVTPEEAVNYICKAAGATFRKDENGVYILGHAKAGGSTGSADSSIPPAPAAPKHIHKFKLAHADAKEVVMELSGHGAEVDPYTPFEEINRFNELTDNAKKNKVTPAPLYLLGNGPNGTAFQPVSTQNYNTPKTFNESGSDIALPGESAGQLGGAGGGGFGGGGGGFGGQGVGGLGGGGCIGGLGGQAGGFGGGQGGNQFGGLGGAQQIGGSLIPQGIPYFAWDPTDNSIVVQASDDQIRQLQDAISFFDVAPKQVTVKVEFVTTTYDSTKDLGFDFTYTRGNIVAGTLPGQFTSASDPIFLSWTVGNIAARMRTQLTHDQGKVVNAPIIRTMNNQPANVSQGTQTWIFFNQVVSIGNGNVISQEQPTAVNITTALNVRPRINNDGTITMALSPQIQDFAGSVTAPDGSQLPVTETQSLNVVARVKSGETIALAGFTRKSDTGTDQRLPILGDLPIIGQLFRHTSHLDNNSELIIFVTPSIIEDENGGLGP